MTSNSETPLDALCAFLETKCACQPDESTEDGVIECQPCQWVGAIQALVAERASATGHYPKEPKP